MVFIEFEEDSRYDSIKIINTLFAEAISQSIPVSRQLVITLSGSENTLAFIHKLKASNPLSLNGFASDDVEICEIYAVNYNPTKGKATTQLMIPPVSFSALSKEAIGQIKKFSVRNGLLYRADMWKEPYFNATYQSMRKEVIYYYQEFKAYVSLYNIYEFTELTLEGDLKQHDIDIVGISPFGVEAHYRYKDGQDYFSLLYRMHNEVYVISDVDRDNNTLMFVNKKNRSDTISIKVGKYQDIGMLHL